MSAKNISVPNPNYVSAPYEQKGYVASEKALHDLIAEVEARFGITVKFEITSYEGGVAWYHLKEV